MGEETIKRELNRAVKSAIKILERPKGTHQIIVLDGNPFHIEYIREKEVLKIRITLNEVTENDKRIVQEFDLPKIIFTKEIWCKKEGKLNFIAQKVN